MIERISENIKRIQGTIGEACVRSNRSTDDVLLVAVTKSVEVDAIQALLKLGQLDVAESRVQELSDKYEAIEATLDRRIAPPSLTPRPKPPAPNWHMIGHLQRNKVKPILPYVHMIHSMDSLRLAEEINTTAARLGLDHKVKILLQVNAGQEKQKYGLAVGAMIPLAEQVATLPNLEIVGLMTMAPLTEDQKKIRFCFERCRELFEEMQGERVAGPAFKHLSMGMSQDYEIAVECGATMLRIGTALFA